MSDSQIECLIPTKIKLILRKLLCLDNEVTLKLVL